MAIFSLDFNTGRLESPIVAPKLETAVNIRNLGMQLESGMMDVLTLAAKSTPLNASGTVTIASGAGVIEAIINGVTIGVTWATSDTATAAALAAAINASVDALVSGLVTASAALGVVTLTSADKTKTANAITLAAAGTGATASGARLTGGSDGTSTAFTF